MTANKGERARYPLQLHIGLLFISLMLVISLTLGWFSYRHISRLVMEATQELFHAVPAELEQTFAMTYRPINTAVSVLASSPLAMTESVEARLRVLPILAEVIAAEPQVSGFQLGYPDGDYFILRPLPDAATRELFGAPDGALFVVDHINDTGAGREQVRLYLDPGLQTLAESLLGPVEYDPRERPWYRQALQDPGRNHTTDPYRFYFLQRYGLTLSRLSGSGSAVLAADVTLDSLSETLAAQRLSPTAFALLADSDGEILAQYGVGIDNNAGDILTLDGLSSALPSALRAAAPDAQGVRRFSYQGEYWLGVVEPMAIASQKSLQLLVAAPEQELFASAIELRRNSVLLTLAVILLAIPVAWFAANQIARPLRELAVKTRAITRLDFSGEPSPPSAISEVVYLQNSIELMKSTISNFLNLINSLSGERNIERLLEKVAEETMQASGADAAVVFLLADDESCLEPRSPAFRDVTERARLKLTAYPLDGESTHPLVQHFRSGELGVIDVVRDDEQFPALASFCEALDCERLSVVLLPLQDRQESGEGILCLAFRRLDDLGPERIGFSQALSGFAAVTLESGQLLRMQKQLLQSFIELIAGAIDAKSPYTGGHCQRVPALTRMLAEAACDSSEGLFADFELDEEQWEALHIASWLHDCGKVTTPEFVVDKSTKLETITDRIHEVRMRFEVLKRDAEVAYWRAVAEGADAEALFPELQAELARLDEDFAFVAQCNEGGEFLADENIARLQQIAQRTWQRTLDDRIGISWEEKQRKERAPAPELPVDEALLADKLEHLIPRLDQAQFQPDNRWGFRLDVPEHKYNRGELHNLAVRRGTLADEERFMINDHMVQTIIMLDQLPFPRHLRNVPEIAGGHHEKMDGTGYPRRLRKEDMSLTARMMAIADIFEALTAGDRPYKKAKTLSASVAIMARMAAESHIDPDLFALFLRSGVYRRYAAEFLAADQIDEVDVDAALASAVP